MTEHSPDYLAGFKAAQTMAAEVADDSRQEVEAGAEILADIDANAVMANSVVANAVMRLEARAFEASHIARRILALTPETPDGQ